MRYSQEGHVSVSDRSIYIRHSIGGRGDTAEAGISLPEAFRQHPPLCKRPCYSFPPGASNPTLGVLYHLYSVDLFIGVTSIWIMSTIVPIAKPSIYWHVGKAIWWREEPWRGPKLVSRKCSSLQSLETDCIVRLSRYVVFVVVQENWIEKRSLFLTGVFFLHLWD